MARMRAVINSIKHYVQLDNTVVGSAAVRVEDLVNAVTQSAAGAATDEVLEGSIVKAIYIEMWIKSGATAGNDTKFQLALEKLPAGGTPLTFAGMNNMMAYVNKKNVFYFTQGVIGDLTIQGVPVVRQWFKIPRGKQRFGLGDRFVVTISATGFNIDTCGFATYKEYK